MTTEDGMFSPDGWGVYHHWSEPVDDVHGYMFGPFPTYDIAAFIMASSPCKCVTSLVPLMFPAHISMVADLRDVAASMLPVPHGDLIN
jgi:hypothetical protein